LQLLLPFIQKRNELYLTFFSCCSVLTMSSTEVEEKSFGDRDNRDMGRGRGESSYGGRGRSEGRGRGDGRGRGRGAGRYVSFILHPSSIAIAPL